MKINKVSISYTGLQRYAYYRNRRWVWGLDAVESRKYKRRYQKVNREPYPSDVWEVWNANK
jgi:hypothetical protein